jgi:hypothetical protein
VIQLAGLERQHGKMTCFRPGLVSPCFAILSHRLSHHVPPPRVPSAVHLGMGTLSQRGGLKVAQRLSGLLQILTTEQINCADDWNTYDVAYFVLGVD